MLAEKTPKPTNDAEVCTCGGRIVRQTQKFRDERYCERCFQVAPPALTPDFGRSVLRPGGIPDRRLGGAGPELPALRHTIENSRTHTETHLKRAHEEVERLVGKLELPTIVGEEAVHILEKTNGSITAPRVLGAVLLAAKRRGISVTDTDLSRIDVEITRKTIEFTAQKGAAKKEMLLAKPMPGGRLPDGSVAAHRVELPKETTEERLARLARNAVALEALRATPVSELGPRAREQLGLPPLSGAERRKRSRTRPRVVQDVKVRAHTRRSR